MNTSYVWDKIWSQVKDDREFWWWVQRENTGVRGSKIISYIQKYLGGISGLKTVEVGSGSGVYSFIFAQRGAAVTLIDRSQNALLLARRYFYSKGLSASFVCMDALKLNLDLWGKFDIAMSFGTIEHFKYPQRFLMTKAHIDLVRPGGIVIISVPNRLFFLHGILKFYLEKKRKWQLGYEEDFRRKELFALSKKLGLEGIEIYGSAFISDMLRYLSIFLRRDYTLTNDFSSPFDNLLGADIFLMGRKPLLK